MSKQNNQNWIALVSMAVGLLGIGIITWKIKKDLDRHKELVAKIEQNK